jgi:hypothetical protein
MISLSTLHLASSEPVAQIIAEMLRRSCESAGSSPVRCRQVCTSLDPVWCRQIASSRHAYSSRGLVRGVDFDEASVVRGAHHRERFDFTVLNGRVVQLVQAWSFQVPGQEELLEKIKDWAWTVEDIRKNGGEAQISERFVAVPTNVDVAAVFVPPSADSQSKALEEAMSAFGEVGARAVSLTEALDVATRARTLLQKSR